MLIIRLQPNGRTHNIVYRIVVAQKAKAVSKKFHEVLGTYNPKTKLFNINQERAQFFIENNIEMSETVRSLFKKNGLLEK
jgi:small subunit ribosomal protein S16